VYWQIREIRRTGSSILPSAAADNSIAGGEPIWFHDIMPDPVAIHDYQPEHESAALEFLKRARWDLRMLRKVHVYTDRFQVIDVNGDCLEVRGIGYRDAAITGLLRAVNTAFDPATIHNPTDAEYKEFATGRRHAWAEDRVM
jgi:hypothetical protein